MKDPRDREPATTLGASTTASASAEEMFAAAVAALPRNHGALGRYVLLHIIGRGGMGVVWEAFDTVLDRRIALKLLIPRLETSESVVVEARVLARVQHPNVVVVHDAGVYDEGGSNLAYVAMELVTGKNLKQWLAEPRSPADVLAMFLLAGRGLEAAHAAGVIHRDFKPSNVLISDDGRVRVSAPAITTGPCATTEEALAVREHMAGLEDPDCAALHNNTANVYRDQKRYDDARAALTRARDIWQKAWGPESPAVAPAISGMGRIAMAEGEPAAAEPLFRQAVAIMRKKREPGHPDLLGDVALLAESLLAMHKPEALGLFEEVLAGTEMDGDATEGDKAYARFWAARARVELGIRREGALELAEMSCNALDQKDWRSDHTACHAWLAVHSK